MQLKPEAMCCPPSSNPPEPTTDNDNDKQDPDDLNLPIQNFPPIPPSHNKPQLHSHKHHSQAAYNGSRHLPLSTRIRRSAAHHFHLYHSLLSNPSDDDDIPQRREPVFEVTLFYARNRACTLFRTREDFDALVAGSGIPPLKREGWKGRGKVDVGFLERVLGEAIAKRPGECAVEYFLRRRMGDCGY
ncbi:hypothetical protein QBC47DRAFT_404727 [Echria macrotheca]|uniref:Uncharacterized protein n=1 Tax=Echria macrotheca TaxID=438768 RepID=A0AAJ0B640_9PEZI|nr:hypothetical protein QBC47DRAFT_404727 [Echria macrotheca]